MVGLVFFAVEAGAGVYEDACEVGLLSRFGGFREHGGRSFGEHLSVVGV